MGENFELMRGWLKKNIKTRVYKVKALFSNKCFRVFRKMDKGEKSLILDYLFSIKLKLKIRKSNTLSKITEEIKHQQEDSDC